MSRLTGLRGVGSDRNPDTLAPPTGIRPIPGGEHGPGGGVTKVLGKALGDVDGVPDPPDVDVADRTQKTPELPGPVIMIVVSPPASGHVATHPARGAVCGSVGP